MSTATPMTFWPESAGISAVSSAANSSTAAPSRSAAATLHPSATSLRTTRRPMPRGAPAPVTSAVRAAGKGWMVLVSMVIGFSFERGCRGGEASGALLGEGRGEHLADVVHVLGDHAERVGAVVLAAERPGVAELEGAADHAAVVDVAVLQRHRGARVGAGGRVEVARVVLDVPEVRVRQDLLEHVRPGLHLAMQAHQVAEVGVQADGVVVDVGDEGDGLVGGADVGVLVHLQAQLDALRGRGVAELAHPLARAVAQRRVVHVAVLEPEPDGLSLLLGEGLHEPGVHDGHAEARGELDEAVRIGEVLDRKSTRLNSSHVSISYAVFCLKKKKDKHKCQTACYQ